MVSDGLLFLVGVVFRGRGVLFLVFDGPPLPLPFRYPVDIPPETAPRGSGAAKVKASTEGVGLVFEAGPEGCGVLLSDIAKHCGKIS